MAESNTFELIIVPVGKNQRINLELPQGQDTTIAALSTLVRLRLPEYEEEKQLVIFAGQRLDPSQTLKDYGIESGKVIHIGLSRTASAPPPKKPAPSSSSSTETNPSVFDDDRSKQKLIDDVAAAVRRLKQLPRAQFLDAVRMLHKIVSNIVDKPDEPKYRRLRKTNTKLCTTLLDHAGGEQALEALGFRPSIEEPDTLFVRKASQHLGYIRRLIQEAMSYHSIPYSRSSGPVRSSSSTSSSSGSAPPFGMPPGMPPMPPGMDFGAIAQQAQQLMQDPQFRDTMTSFAQQMMGGQPPVPPSSSSASSSSVETRPAEGSSSSTTTRTNPDGSVTTETTSSSSSSQAQQSEDGSTTSTSHSTTTTTTSTTSRTDHDDHHASLDDPDSDVPELD